MSVTVVTYSPPEAKENPQMEIDEEKGGLMVDRGMHKEREN